MARRIGGFLAFSFVVVEIIMCVADPFEIGQMAEDITRDGWEEDTETGSEPGAEVF